MQRLIRAALAGALALASLGAGHSNGVFLEADGFGCDSAWNVTGSGIVHQWADLESCSDLVEEFDLEGEANLNALHVVFKPETRTLRNGRTQDLNPSCDATGLLDDRPVPGDWTTALEDGTTYLACLYRASDEAWGSFQVNPGITFHVWLDSPIRAAGGWAQVDAGEPVAMDCVVIEGDTATFGNVTEDGPFSGGRIVVTDGDPDTAQFGLFARSVNPAPDPCVDEPQGTVDGTDVDVTVYLGS